MPDNFQPIDPTFKAEWVAALRSGKYGQTKYKLHTDAGYCCLGVACELILGRDGWEPTNSHLLVKVYKIEGEAVSHGRGVTLPSFGLRAKMGLTHEVEAHLSTMNDNGADFDQIADWIEENL